jgi:hypothetical protein
MNCCNDYGNCNQGRDCPARAKLAENDDDIGALETIMCMAVTMMAVGILLVVAGIAAGFVYAHWVA